MQSFESELQVLLFYCIQNIENKSYFNATEYFFFNENQQRKVTHQNCAKILLINALSLMR